MPVYKPIVSRCQESVNQVKEVSKRKFKEGNLTYRESDRSWRHVGMLNDKVYLFDLADLETVDTELQWNEYAEQHEEELLKECHRRE